MKEIVVLSGKGGTGKTSFAASFAALEQDCILADCDVDGSNLHLLFAPNLIGESTFSSGQIANINEHLCRSCMECQKHCHFDAIQVINKKVEVYTPNCEGCGLCTHFCEYSAINLSVNTCGKTYNTKIPGGYLSHARLNIGAENSGKLVNVVKKNAHQIAKSNQSEMIIIDGPPGIGCPVIASLSGCDAAILVTEPTLSGKHDLLRILKLIKHFKIPSFVCVNRWDLNPGMTEEIKNISPLWLGKVSHTPLFKEAQEHRKSIIEYAPNHPISQELQTFWQTVKESIS